MRVAVSSFAVVLGSVAALAAASAAGGCGDPPPALTTGSGGDGAGDEGGGGGGFVDNGKELFAALEADLVEACASCHEPGGIADSPFLAAPDRYESILAWPGIVVVDPATSKLVTWSVTGGGHSGTNIDTIDGLEARIVAWLEAEAAAIQTGEGGGAQDKPTIPPFTPIIGFNAVYLEPLHEDLAGVAITFTAEELTDTTLKLDQLDVHTTSMTGVHIVHPVFAVYPKGAPAEADPVDSFAGLDAFYPQSTSAPLGVGTLILTNWEQGAKLGIGFEVVEPWTEGQGEGGGGGGGPGGGCNALEVFEASAAPAFQARCFNCHGGNDTQATAAVDMSALETNPAEACGQIQNRINPDNPPLSQIFIVTDPNGNAGHIFKFGGNVGQYDAFVDQVTPWVEAE